MAKGAGMKIDKIYVYPIKSFRGVELDSTTLFKHGFPHDRTFMVLRIVDDKETGGKTYENMAVSSYNEMVRFFPSINLPPKAGNDESLAKMTVTYHPLDGNKPRPSIDIPLTPDTSNLEQVDVTMHYSPTKAYKMPPRYNQWLSSCFGYECILVYISDNLREVRMSSTKYKAFEPDAPKNNSAWFSALSSLTSGASQLVGLSKDAPTEVSAVRFSDVAPYLIVSSKSMDDVHRRLPQGEQFDITKFRPNIIVSGAEEPWEEDFWAELTLGFADETGEDAGIGGSRLELEHNCGRCRSINIDYDTGAQGKGEAGTMLKKLMKDRRVDRGSKWSPVFGRYAFLHPGSEGKEVRVGQEARVTRVNRERTDFGRLNSPLQSVYPTLQSVTGMIGRI